MRRARLLPPHAGSRGASWKLDGQTSFRLPLTGEHRGESLERRRHVAIREERRDVRYERRVIRAAHGAQHTPAGERFLNARRLLRLEPGVRGADNQRSRAAGQVAVARERDAVSEMAAEG